VNEAQVCTWSQYLLYAACDGLALFNDYFVRLLYRHWPELTIGCGDAAAVVKVIVDGYGVSLAYHQTINIALHENNAICCRYSF
jgi:hypothetical protein